MERIMGIDFGTTNSAVAFYDGRESRIMTDDYGETIMPSAVHIDDRGRPHVGTAARNVALLYPEHTILSVKRLLGSRRSFHLAGEDYSPERIASFVFAALRERCERRVGEPVRKAVVSVPAYFDDLRRRAVAEAASMAGLDVVRLINEPTAAALAHGIETGTAVVYDLGGGTFDVSVLEIGEGVHRVLSSRGDAHLGSNDFDAKLVAMLMERFHEETGVDLGQDTLALHKLRMEAERAKIELSGKEKARIHIPFISANITGACDLDETIERGELEALAHALIERTIRLTKGALSDAGVSSTEVDHVLLVGGPTRMPMIREAVAKLTGRAPDLNVDPELAVARGAAHQAAIIAGSARRTVLVDVTPLGLGVEAVGDEFVNLLPRNTVLPAHASAVFTTVRDNQRRARVTVLQGERPRAGENTTIGSFDLENIELGPKGQPEIEVSFDINVSGILAVHARDLATRSEEVVRLMPHAEVDEQEAEKIVEEARLAEIETILFKDGGAKL